jgi:hypothetical protein
MASIDYLLLLIRRFYSGDEQESIRHDKFASYKINLPLR